MPVGHHQERRRVLAVAHQQLSGVPAPADGGGQHRVATRDGEPREEARAGSGSSRHEASIAALPVVPARAPGPSTGSGAPQQPLPVSPWGTPTAGARTHSLWPAPSDGSVSARTPRFAGPRAPVCRLDDTTRKEEWLRSTGDNDGVPAAPAPAAP
ncbi:hypothetical protein GCM10009593_09600 [Microlunatus antarcticus]